MSTDNKSRDLYDELKTLQRVLDDAAGEQIDLERALTQLNTVEEVPVLSDLFGSDDDIPALKPVKRPTPPQQQEAVYTRPQQPVTTDVMEYLREEMARKGLDDNSIETLAMMMEGRNQNKP